MGRGTGPGVAAARQWPLFPAEARPVSGVRRREGTTRGGRSACAASPRSRLRPSPWPAVVPGEAALDPDARLHLSGTPVEVDPATRQQEVAGLVDRPLSLAYAKLRCLPEVEASPIRECPGCFVDEATWAGRRSVRSSSGSRFGRPPPGSGRPQPMGTLRWWFSLRRPCSRRSRPTRCRARPCRPCMDSRCVPGYPATRASTGSGGWCESRREARAVARHPRPSGARIRSRLVGNWAEESRCPAEGPPGPRADGSAARHRRRTDAPG